MIRNLIGSIALAMIALGIGILIYSNVKLSGRANELESELNKCQAEKAKAETSLAELEETIKKMERADLKLHSSFDFIDINNCVDAICGQRLGTETDIPYQVAVDSRTGKCTHVVTSMGYLRLDNNMMLCPFCGSIQKIPDSIDNDTPFNCPCGFHGRIWGSGLVWGKNID